LSKNTKNGKVNGKFKKKICLENDGMQCVRG